MLYMQLCVWTVKEYKYPRKTKKTLQKESTEMLKHIPWKVYLKSSSQTSDLSTKY